MSARDFASLTHIDFGEPLQRWRYTDSFATALFIDKRRRRKVKASAVHNGHQCYWHTPPGSLPLYGLASLGAKPIAPVLVVQSEEAADAARELFPDHVGMTWAGGPNAVNQADTAPLGGRDVILWRDNDPESETAMARFAVRLRGFARSVTIVDVPRTWPQKWHLAHDLPPDATVAMRRRMLPPPVPQRDEDSVAPHVLGARHSVARQAKPEAETRESEPPTGVSHRHSVAVVGRLVPARSAHRRCADRLRRHVAADRGGRPDRRRAAHQPGAGMARAVRAVDRPGGHAVVGQVAWDAGGAGPDASAAARSGHDRRERVSPPRRRTRSGAGACAPVAPGRAQLGDRRRRPRSTAG